MATSPPGLASMAVRSPGLLACLSFPWRHRALWGCVGVEVVNGFIFVRLLARAAPRLWCPVLLTLCCASWQQGMNQMGSTTAWISCWLAGSEPCLWPKRC